MLPANETQISAQWLTGVLQESGTLPRGRVRSVSAQRIAEGVGLMARLSRLTLQYEGADAGAPGTLIAKQPIDLPQNLLIAQVYRFYEREGAFYRELASRTPLRVPRCHAFVRDDAGGFLLLLEDLGGARLGDQLAGNRAEDALTAIAALAEHHALFWGKAQAMDFLVDFHAPEFCQILEFSYGGALQPALDAYANRFTPPLAELARGLVKATTALMLRNKQRNLTVCHGDFRADNLFYDLADGSRVAVIDWQISGRGFGFFDVAYHLTQSVTSQVRREIERAAIERYHEVLTSHGIRDYSLADLWEEYREAALLALVYPITVCGALDLSNERARALGDIFLARSLDAITDLKAGQKLP